jgi:hypothetical protein
MDGMNSCYLMTITVPIPAEDKMVVIRNGKKVEYETERIYVGNRSTRVKRKVIGKVDPVQAGRMFPNEAYFELFPENEVPEEIRNEFLRECAIRRQMKVIRQNPEDIADQVVRGMEQMRNDTSSGLRPPAWAAARTPTENEHTGSFSGRFVPPQGEGYAVLRRVFDEIYYAIEELAGRFPNEVVVPFKVERINEVLSSLRDSIEDEKMKPFLRLIEEGLTYSDVMLLLKWYKVLPR